MKLIEKISKKSFEDFILATKAVFKDAWREHRKQLISLIFLSLLIALGPYVVNGIAALLINHLVEVAGTHMVTPLLVILLLVSIAVFFLQGVLYVFMRYRMKVSWFDTQPRYELKHSGKMYQLDMATHEDPVFRDQVQITRERGSSFAVASFLENYIVNLQNVVGLLIASVIVFAADWRLLVLILIVSLPKLYSELRYGEGVWSIYQSQSEDRRLYWEIRRHAEDMTSIRELQTFQTIPYFLQRQSEHLVRFLNAQKAEEKKRFGMLALSQLPITVGIGVSMTVLIFAVLSGDMQIGTFGFVLGAVIGFQETIAGFFLALATQHRDARYVKTYFDMIERKSMIVSPENPKRLDLERAPVIEFVDVSFAYPTKPDEMVLKDFSLTIGSGERLGIVGINGAGKSTLLKLLFRFYDPTKGYITINGIDLREIDLEEWYSYLALLSQDYTTYQFTVRELIALGRVNGSVNQTKVEEAARNAQAHAFIEKWEKQYKQQIGVQFKGVDPSVGQEQRLALARTLFRNAFITALDEPTAHLDANAEKEIFDRLKPDSTQTLLLISHRFSTLRNVDRICVIENGSVEEIGTHAALMESQGTYAKLFTTQAEGYK